MTISILLFLSRYDFNAVELHHSDDALSAKYSDHVPTVLNPSDVTAAIQRISGAYQLLIQFASRHWPSIVNQARVKLNTLLHF